MFGSVKKQIFHPQTLFLFTTFFIVRGISFFILPYHTLQNILALAFVCVLVFFYFKKPALAWNLLLAEIFLGGSGHFVELWGLSLRTLFLVVYIFLYTGERLFQKSKRQELLLPKNLSFLFGAFLLALIWSVTNGIIQGNPITLIIQDTIPFAFFALLLPAHQMLKEKHNQIFLLRLALVFILGSALFSLFTFILFSREITFLQGPYYKWFRDILGGKITNLGSGFWRIVLPEHLFLLPLTVIVSSLLMKKFASKGLFILLLCSTFVLTLNLSRAYFLALLVALLVLLYGRSFKKWLSISTLTLGSILLFFCTTYFLASGGKTFGLELFGLRLKSFTAPQIEESTHTRSALLEPILKKIETHPVVGSGLGSSVTFTNPVTHQKVTTPQFDWGYLEIMTEFGILGGLVYFFLLLFIMYLTVQYIKNTTLHPDFFVGLLGGLVALCITNLTAPALFHVFGVVYITLVLGVILHTNDIFEKIKLRITQLFHRFVS